MSLRAASRGSRLALRQAEIVRARLLAQNPAQDIEIIVVHTTGDRITDVPLSRIGDRGLFTKELDRAVLDGSADFAVHSLKDIPTQLADGLELAAVLEREEPRDVLVVAPGQPPSLEHLPRGARVGTSSLRRRALLLAMRPDLLVVDLRGNLDTRLAQVNAGHYDAAILALAGLMRIGRSDQVAQVLEPPDWLPAVGQGALGLLARADDRSTRTLLAPLDHPATRAATIAERALLATLEGGCQIPIGALATVDAELELHAFVASVDGQQIVRGVRSSAPAQAATLGRELAAELLAQGARTILDQLRASLTTAPASP